MVCPHSPRLQEAIVSQHLRAQTLYKVNSIVQRAVFLQAKSNQNFIEFYLNDSANILLLCFSNSNNCRRHSSVNKLTFGKNK